MHLNNEEDSVPVGEDEGDENDCLTAADEMQQNDPLIFARNHHR